MGETCSRYGEHRGAYRVLVRRLREKYHLEDLDLDGSIILKWISKRWDVAAWTGLLQFRIMTGRTEPVNAVMNNQVQ